MGKQHNKIEKKRRRKLYLRRKQLREKENEIKGALKSKKSGTPAKNAEGDSKPAATKKAATKKAATKKAAKKKTAKKAAAKKATAEKEAAPPAPTTESPSQPADSPDTSS